MILSSGLLTTAFPGFSETRTECFDRIWNTARENIFPEDRQALFSELTRDRLKHQLEGADSLQQLATVVNPFLERLGVSHTRPLQE